MIIPLLARVAEGFIAPRRALRRLLDEGPHGAQTLVLFLLLAYVVQELFILLTLPGARPDGTDPLNWHVERVIFGFIEFGVTTGLVFGVGRLFGGSGTLPDAAATIAWFSLLTSFLVPLTAPALPGLFGGELTGPAALLLLAGVGLFCWALAGCIAELHSFRSTGSVLMAMFGMIALMTLIANTLFSAG